MQNALVGEQVAEAGQLAQQFVTAYPDHEGVPLAYTLQAMAALEQTQDQEGPPDFTEAKQLLEKALTGPGDPGSKLFAAMFRVIVEFIEQFIKALMQMGEAMEQGMQ